MPWTGQRKGRRCRAPSGAAAGRSAGTPCPSCGAGSRSARARCACSRSRPSKQDLAGGRFDQPRQAAHERRLAGARQAHDDEDLAFADVERHRAHCADEAGVRRSVAGRRSLPSAQEYLGVAAEQLPDVPAADLHRPIPCIEAESRSVLFAMSAIATAPSRAVTAAVPIAERDFLGRA